MQKSLKLFNTISLQIFDLIKSLKSIKVFSIDIRGFMLYISHTCRYSDEETKCSSSASVCQ